MKACAFVLLDGLGELKPLAPEPGLSLTLCLPGSQDQPSWTQHFLPRTWMESSGWVGSSLGPVRLEAGSGPQPAQEAWHLS